MIMTPDKKINRRKFMGSAAAASLAFTIVPRHVLGGPAFVPPSDKVTLAYIGCGTQGMREMTELIPNPLLQIVSVCDPNKKSTNYSDWSINGIRNGFRELLEKEKDIDAVKVMTPDHLHGTISIAAMKKGKHVVIHKPIANRMYETRLTIETARKTGVSTHLLAWSLRPGTEVVKKWIQDDAIGTLREIHNWSNRPVWPQWTMNPSETPPIPADFNWDLWLGPVPDRPYHPNYTNMVFRGWYDFGGGSIADMGHYSLFPLFLTLGIKTPAFSAEALGTTTSQVTNHVSRGVMNDVAFPHSCIVRFKFAQQETLPAFDLFWYDGGMKPATPDEVDVDGKELTREGMMFVGDKGKILAGFRCEDPLLVPESKMKSYMGGKEMQKEVRERTEDVWIKAFKDKTQSPGS